MTPDLDIVWSSQLGTSSSRESSVKLIMNRVYDQACAIGQYSVSAASTQPLILNINTLTGKSLWAKYLDGGTVTRKDYVNDAEISADGMFLYVVGHFQSTILKPAAVTGTIYAQVLFKVSLATKAITYAA